MLKKQEICLKKSLGNVFCKKTPDIDENSFIDLVEAFLRGFDKGVAVVHNIFLPDSKLCVFDK